MLYLLVGIPVRNYFDNMHREQQGVTVLPPGASESYHANLEQALTTKVRAVAGGILVESYNYQGSGEETERLTVTRYAPTSVAHARLFAQLCAITTLYFQQRGFVSRDELDGIEQTARAGARN
jgi:hypothetical protein